MTKIIKCKIENILGVKDVEFAPEGKSVTIGGANGQGKTSTIWALIMALGGKDKMPLRPIRDGAEKGEVVVELEDKKVRLVVQEGRKSTLTVESLEGAQYKQPQSLLNGLFGDLSFDPGQFKSMRPIEQKGLLLNLAKLDFTSLEQEKAEVYAKRTDTKRYVNALTAELSDKTIDKTLPTEKQSDAELQKELAVIDSKYEEHSKLTSKMQEAYGRANVAKAIVANTEKEIAELELRLIALRGVLKSENEIATKEATLAVELEQQLPLLPSNSEITEKFNQLNTTNAKIDYNNKLIKTYDALQKAEAEVKAFTERLEAIELEKVEMLQKANLPIKDLSFDENGVLYKGIPLEQIAESQQWEISTAIGFALNPQGIVFMRAGGGLDKKSRERVRARAAHLGVQLFLEVVDDAEDVQILIEEGSVSKNRLSKEASE
jgi:hypothetical protein